MTRALLEQALDALDGLVKWDSRRDFVVPYRVRDPIHDAAKSIRAHLAILEDKASIGADRAAQPQGEPAIGCKCPLCGEWQRSTRSGMVCKNGHGGATGLNRRLFTHPAHTEAEVQEIMDMVPAMYEIEETVRRILGVPE